MNAIDKINKRLDYQSANAGLQDSRIKDLERTFRTHEMRLNAQKTEIAELKTDKLDKPVAFNPWESRSMVYTVPPPRPRGTVILDEADYKRLKEIEAAADAYVNHMGNKPYTDTESYNLWKNLDDIFRPFNVFSRNF